MRAVCSENCTYGSGKTCSLQGGLVISLLSMGAVFSVFAAYYYWSPRMFGYQYNELLGKIQFWLFFIGVNLTFAPLHFLG